MYVIGFVIAVIVLNKSARRCMVLIIGLTYVGLSTLYIEKGESFGARPSSDYLALLLWGLSADVASRSLSSLRGQEE